MAEVYYKFISDGKMQLRLEVWQRFITSLLVGIWQRFIPSLLLGDRSAEVGDLAEVYYKFFNDGKMQLRLEVWQRFITSLLVGIWQRFIPSLLVGDRCS